MNTELVNHFEKLSEASANARTGDIASMAALLDQFETLRQFAEIHRIPDLGQPAEALGECIKRIIMQAAEDPEGDMQILRDAVAVIQSSISSGDLPPREVYPAGLRWPEQAAGEPAPDSPTDEEVREGAEVGAQPEAAPPTSQDAVADSAGSEDGFSLSDLPSDAVGGQEGACAAAAPEPSAIEQRQDEPAGQEQAAAPEPPAAAPTQAQPSAAEPGAQPERVQLTADQSLLVDFISESKEHLEHASAQLLSLESDPESEEAVNSVFRAFHTVKGIAEYLNLDEIAMLAHNTENLLDQVRRHELILTPAVVDLVFEALDWMTRLIGNVSKALQSDGMVSAEPELDPFLSRIKAAQEGKPETPAQAAQPGA